MSHAHTKHGLSLLFVLFFFLLSLSIQAQDTPTEEPAPVEATTQPVPDVLSTEIPS